MANREKITIDKEIIFEIMEDLNDNFSFIEDKIIYSDPEDGGANHELIICRNSDNKYFKLKYSDWDMLYNPEYFLEDLVEVFPERVTTIVFV